MPHRLAAEKTQEKEKRKKERKQNENPGKKFTLPRV